MSLTLSDSPLKGGVRILILSTLLFLSSIIGGQDIRLASSNLQPERKAELRYLCDAFELYNPGVTITLIDFNDETVLDLIGVENNSYQADVIIADSPILHQLVQLGALNLDVSTRILRRMGVNRFYDGAISAFLHTNFEDGVYIGVPYTAWLQLIWYRADLLSLLGLKYPHSPEDLLSFSKTLVDQELVDYGIVLGTDQDRYLLQSFYQLVLLSRAGNTHGVYPIPNYEELSFYRNLASFSPGMEMGWRARDYYFQQKAGFLLYSTHLMDDLAVEEIAADSLTPNNFDELTGQENSDLLFEKTGFVSQLDYNGETKSFGSVSGWGVFRTNINENLVIKLLNFFFRNDVYISYLHMSPGGMLPVLPEILDDDNFYRDRQAVFARFGKRNITQLCQSIEYLSVMPVNRDYSAVDLFSSIWSDYFTER